MKIVIAPDSFKESMTAFEVASAIEKGFKECFPEASYVKVPMADGGEGTVQSLVDALDGELKHVMVTGPLGNPVNAFYGIIDEGKTAVIEMAAASGLHLVPTDKRNPLITTTYGTGELILSALNEGVTHIILGIGGSATNDGGAGLLQALGVRLLDINGQQLESGGGTLNQLTTIDYDKMDHRISTTIFEVACDVDNPLCGPNGASAIYGPQKGATEEMVAQLDQNLHHFSQVIKKELGEDVSEIPGAGAAGGIGAGLLAFLPVDLKPGIEIVMGITQLDKQLQDADLVITGEGRMDSQTIFGKTPIGVAKLAKKHGRQVLGFAGSLSKDYEVVLAHGIDAAFSIVQGVTTLPQAFEDGEFNLYQTARNVASVIKLSSSLNLK